MRLSCTRCGVIVEGARFNTYKEEETFARDFIDKHLHNGEPDGGVSAFVPFSTPPTTGVVTMSPPIFHMTLNDVSTQLVNDQIDARMSTLADELRNGVSTA